MYTPPTSDRNANWQGTSKHTILRRIERAIVQRDMKVVCAAMVAIAVIKSVFFLELFAFALDETMPHDFLYIAVLVAIFVSAPLVFYSVSSIHRLRSYMHAFREQAATLDQSNRDLAQAESGLREANRTLEARVRERTESLEHARWVAEDANTAKSRFLANMSHELRTPLNAIIGFSDLLVNRREVFGDSDDARTDEYATTVNSAGTHLLALVNDLLDLSRIECGKFDIAPEPLPIADAIRNAVLSLTLQAEKRRNTITVGNTCRSRLVEADARAMNQILVNLLSNALKLSPEGAEIRLDATDDDCGTTFSVTDRGVGISVNDAQEGIRPFARFSEAHTASGESIDLGLAIVDALCMLHGGTLTLDSETGRGTIARAHFPVRAAACAPVTAIKS